MKYKLLLSFFCLFLLLKCSSSSEDSKSELLNYILISDDALPSNGPEGLDPYIAPQNMVINDDNEWQVLMDQMYNIGNAPDFFEGLPINFNESTVIAVFDEISTSCCYDLDIALNLNEDYINASIIRNTTGDNVLTVIVQQYIIVKIPKTELPIQFQ